MLGRRLTPAALDFKEFAEVNLAQLAIDIRTGAWRPDPLRSYTIYEPKPRLITVLSFRDRVTHHALVGIIGPIFEATFLPRSYACREGFGTHAGVIALQAALRRIGDPVYVLKTDFAKFFPSIDRTVLHGLIRRKISCAATLRLIEAIVPPEGVGLPIGSLTSQLFANVYASVIDRHLQTVLRERHWFRYMDDIVVLGLDCDHLRFVRNSIERVAAEILRLRFSKWSIQNARRGVSFLGYRVWPTHKLLRRRSVIRARRRFTSLQRRGDAEGLARFIASWSGHARWADSHNLLQSLGLMMEVTDDH